MIFFLKRLKVLHDSLIKSKLFDENTFYEAFIKDLENAREEVYIESPFITTKRVHTLRPIFEKLISRNINLYILTRDPIEQDEYMKPQEENEIEYFEDIGAQVYIARCDNNKMFHRKLAIIDRKILWEGSLNILSQKHSREFMRRIIGKQMAMQMFKFLNLGKII